jgi:hypothetical protein
MKTRAIPENVLRQARVPFTKLSSLVLGVFGGGLDGEFPMGLDVTKKRTYFGIDESDKKRKRIQLIPCGQILGKDSSRPYF